MKHILALLNCCRRKLFVIIALLLVLVGISLSMYFYMQYQNLRQHPEVASKQEAQLLLEKLGKIIELPDDEEPTVATVTDKTKLTEQPFFSKAENGDKIIVYGKEGQALLYRPSEHKLIAVVPIAFTQPTTETAEQKKQLRVTILNGSKKAGVAEQLKTQLAESFPELLLTTGNALKNNYTKSQLIVVNPAIDAATVAALLSSTNSEKSDIPKGEATLDTDILIIIGSEAI